MKDKARLDARGTVTVEYVVILALVSLPCVIALVALGPVLARLYLVQRAMLLLPMPV